MSIEVLVDNGRAVFICNTTDVAFGPVIEVPAEAYGQYYSVRAYVEAFLDWSRSEIRLLGPLDLDAELAAFRAHCGNQVECEACPGFVSKPAHTCEYCLSEAAQDEQFELDR